MSRWTVRFESTTKRRNKEPQRCESIYVDSHSDPERIEQQVRAIFYPGSSSLICKGSDVDDSQIAASPSVILQDMLASILRGQPSESLSPDSANRTAKLYVHSCIPPPGSRAHTSDGGRQPNTSSRGTAQRGSKLTTQGNNDMRKLITLLCQHDSSFPHGLLAFDDQQDWVKEVIRNSVKAIALADETPLDATKAIKK